MAAAANYPMTGVRCDVTSRICIFSGRFEAPVRTAHSARARHVLAETTPSSRRGAGRALRTVSTAKPGAAGGKCR
jgi:hypothetical protein